MSDKFESELLRGSLDLMILSVLVDQPLYGYSIQQQLQKVSHQRIQLPAGTLYPLLHRLEADKLVRSRLDASTGRRRKWYELTAKGKKRLVAQAKQWREYANCMNVLIGSFAPAS